MYLRGRLWPLALVAGALLVVVLAWDFYEDGARRGAELGLRQTVATQTAEARLVDEARATGTAEAAGLSRLIAQATHTSRERALARARGILANAQAQVGKDLELSVLLAMESISATLQANEPPLPEAEVLLHKLIRHPWPSLTFQTGPGDATRAYFSPDDRNVLIAGIVDRVEVRDR